MKVNIDNDLYLRFKVKATDGRVSWRSHKLKDIIEEYIDEGTAIDKMVSSICNCDQSTESGFNPCDCADNFWDSNDITIELHQIRK